MTVIRGHALRPNFDSVDISGCDTDIIHLNPLKPTGLLASTSIQTEKMEKRERKRLKAGMSLTTSSLGIKPKGTVREEQLHDVGVEDMDIQPVENEKLYGQDARDRGQGRPERQADEDDEADEDEEDKEERDEDTGEF